MAEEFIEEIYKYSDIITQLKEIIEVCRCRDRWLFNKQWNNLSLLVTEYCKLLFRMDQQKAVALWNALEEACKKSDDLICFADILENRILSLVYDSISILGNIDVEEGEWRLYSSKSGFLSLQRLSDGVQINSSIDPMWEAQILAKRLYTPKQQEFYLWGCELGYLAQALYITSDKSLKIHIFELKDELIEYAFHYGVLSNIPSECLEIHTGKNTNKLIDEFCYDSKRGEQGYIGYYIYGWETIYFPQNEMKTINTFRIIQETADRFYKVGLRNFERNRINVKKYINKIDSNLFGDKWIVIAAGPSFNDDVLFIKNNRKLYKIAAVTRMLPRLKEEGIVPDIAVAMDPQNIAYDIIKDKDIDYVPLIIIPSTNWQYGDKYKGQIYFAPVGGMADVNGYIMESGMDNWSVGGTVTSLAIETAIYLGAKELHISGMDLAYPDMQYHAQGAGDEVVSEKGLCLVESNDGGQVYTSKDFKFYISELEEQIKRNKSVVFVNHSLRGAKVKGAILWKN